LETNQRKVLRGIKKIYKETDVRMKGVEKICQKGCSFCCHQVISVHYAEELPIIDYVFNELDDNVKVQLKNNLEKWLDYFLLNTPSKTLNEEDILVFSQKHAQDFIPCPFLIDNICGIYPVRPLVCRTFSVNDNAQLCEEDPIRLGDNKGYRIRDSKFEEMARVSDSFMLRLLPYAVSEQFGIRKRLKPIGVDVLKTYLHISD